MDGGPEVSLADGATALVEEGGGSVAIRRAAGQLAAPACAAPMLHKLATCTNSPHLHELATRAAHTSHTLHTLPARHRGCCRRGRGGRGLLGAPAWASGWRRRRLGGCVEAMPSGPVRLEGGREGGRESVRVCMRVCVRERERGVGGVGGTGGGERVSE